MKTSDMVSYSVKSLYHSQLRTWLTILGILIGICSVIVLVSIGEGLNHSINEQLAQFGAKSIVVIPVNIQASSSSMSFSPGGATTSGKLFQRDIDEIKKLGTIDLITGVVSQRVSLGFKGLEITGSIYGIEPDLFRQLATDMEVEEGRFLTDADRGVVVLGNNLATTSFGKNKVSVNSYVQINGNNYRVVGILKKAGSSFSAADSTAFVHMQDARDIAGPGIGDKEVTVIRLNVKDDADVEQVGLDIAERLRNLHRAKEGEEDFSVITPKFINDTVGSITSLLTIFLGAIAAISLIVGGVGIMNTMFMSVVERTKEIGTLKAIGASEKEILSIFLIESGVIGLIGGFVGIILAVAILLVVGKFGVPVFMDPVVIIGAFLFSFMIGLLSGFIPARGAARISPLEALRYE